MMLEAVSAWLQQCPLLAGQRINANYLGADALDWALIEAPTTPVLTRYMDGSTLRQKAYALTAVQDYSPDLLMQLAASGIWEGISEWIQAQAFYRKNLPDLGEGKTCTKVEVTATHSIIYSSAQTARYQLQIMITYFQKG